MLGGNVLWKCLLESLFDEKLENETNYWAKTKTTEGYYASSVNTAATGIAATGIVATGVTAAPSGSGDGGDLTILGDRTLSKMTIYDVEDQIGNV